MVVRWGGLPIGIDVNGSKIDPQYLMVANEVRPNFLIISVGVTLNFIRGGRTVETFETNLH